MGDDIAKGTTYATGGSGGQGVITSANLNAHVDDAVIKPTFISAKVARTPGVLTDQILLESGGALYRMLFSTLQSLLVTPAAIPAGSVIQTVAATPYTANANITTVIPADDTYPQITEGTEILTLAITPSFTTSRIRLTYHGFCSASIAVNIATALFRTGTANALKASLGYLSSGNLETTLDWIDNPASISSQTYTLRIGPSTAATIRMNGSVAARIFGGAAACTLVAQEIR